MKRSISVLLALGLGMAGAASVKLGNLPVTVDSNPKLLTLTQDGIRAIFPSAAGRPDAVFMTDDRKVSVAFEWRNGKLAPNEIDKLASQFPAVIRSQIPSLKSLKSGLTQIGNQSWAQFVFTTPGKSDDLRRELLMTSLGGRVLVVTIAANVKDYSKNETLVRNFVNSIRLN